MALGGVPLSFDDAFSEADQRMYAQKAGRHDTP